MKISFAERYILLQSLNFDDSMNEFLSVLENFNAELKYNIEASVLPAEVSTNLTRLVSLITKGMDLDELRLSQLKLTSDLPVSRFRTTYD